MASTTKKPISGSEEYPWTWYEHIVIWCGIKTPDELRLNNNKKYTPMAYVFALAVAFLIAFSCGFITGYAVFAAGGGLAWGILVGVAGMALNLYLYFPDTLDLYYDFYTGNVFKCQAEKSNTENISNIKGLLLALILLLSAADGVANFTLTLASTHGFLLSLGATGAALTVTPWIFASAMLFGNMALMFIAMKVILTNPQSILAFIKKIVAPKPKQGEKKDNPKYAARVALRVFFAVAALAIGVIATIALLGVWKSDLQTFMVGGMHLADKLANTLSVALVWGLALIPELVFNAKCAANFAQMLVFKIEEAWSFKWSEWSQGKSNWEIGKTIIWNTLKFTLGLGLVIINALGNGKLGLMGARAVQKVFAFISTGLVNLFSAINSAFVMITYTNLLGKTEELKSTQTSVKTAMNPLPAEALQTNSKINPVAMWVIACTISRKRDTAPDAPQESP